MFRTAVLRAARLPRAAAVSSSLLAGVRSALRTAGPLRVAPLALTVSVLPLFSAKSRAYSSATATAASSEQPVAARNPDDPVSKFADLTALGVHEHVVRAITDTMNYETMTPVQSKTIHPGLAGKDMVAQAKTGTGKTLAFLVPVVQKIIAENPDLAYPRRVRARSDDIVAIVLSPTRELAEQIGAEARTLCRNTGVIVQTAVGGTRKREMLNRTRHQGCHLLIATPGRLNDLLDDPESGIDAPNLSILVLDEADRMLDVGFETELRSIVEKLPNATRQTMLFSATIPKNVISLARAYVDAQNFVFVQTIDPNESLTHEKVPQHILSVRGYENVYPAILELVEREMVACQGTEYPFKAIVFLPTTTYVQLTAMAFQRLKKENEDLPDLFHIHSKLTQAARTDAADMFRASDSAILFSSDVTARGMDFPNVTHVIQVGVPPDREQYIHRLGRTGRANKGGQGWVIVQEDEMNLARNVLTNLPITRAQGIQSAEHNLENTDSATTPATVTKVNGVMKWMPKRLLRDVYLSFFGGPNSGRSMQSTLDSLNNWVRLGWRWLEPPAISYDLARRRGLLNLRGVRIASEEEMETRKSYWEQHDNWAFDQKFAQPGSRRDDRHEWRDHTNRRNSRDSRGPHSQKRPSFESHFDNRIDSSNRGGQRSGYNHGRSGGRDFSRSGSRSGSRSAPRSSF